MLKVSYDNKPLPDKIKRIRMNVVDSFINAEIIEIDKKITEMLRIRTKYTDNTLQKFKNYKNCLQQEIEIKRVFQIRLQSILSWRRPEAILFIKKLNEDNFLDY